MVYCFLADGFEEVEAIAPVDMLRRAGIEIKTVGVTGDAVSSSHGIKVIADISLSEVVLDDSLEAVILPGGLPGATNLDAHQGLSDMIMAFASEGKALAAICAAPLVFGNRGLLQGKKATCYPGFESYLTGAEYTAALVETDGNFITAKGPGAAMDFAFAIVEKYCGIEKVNELKSGMMIKA